VGNQDGSRDEEETYSKHITMAYIDDIHQLRQSIPLQELGCKLLLLDILRQIKERHPERCGGAVLAVIRRETFNHLDCLELWRIHEPQGRLGANFLAEVLISDEFVVLVSQREEGGRFVDLEVLAQLLDYFCYCLKTDYSLASSDNDARYTD
jgi:hypothetical protein